MVEVSLFSDYFWGDKHQGFDVLYQNMKCGLKTSVEFLEFLREVYCMEDTCTKGWLKLSKQLNINSSGTLQPLWIFLKELSEKRSLVHMEVCQGMQVIMKFLQKYIEEQQIKQKATKDNDAHTQNFNNLLLTTAGQLARARDTYHIRHSELQKINAADLNPVTKSREIEKVETKLKKAVDEYKYVIDKYNNTCGKYKSKMTESCKNFQDIEKYHLEQMKEFIQKFSQTLFKAQTEFRIQEKEFSDVQEKFTVEFLLESFVKSKSTGKIPPDVVKFEEADESSACKLSKVSSQTSNDSELNITLPNDAPIGNLVNIDSPTETSHPHVNNINMAVQPIKDCLNDIFDRISMASDNNGSNHNSRSTLDLSNKKQKKYNNIFRRRRNSPTNDENNKPLQSLGKEQSSQSLGDFLVDDEGFSIKPEDKWSQNNDDRDSDSSSGDDNDENTFKGIKIEIKPQKSHSNSSSIPDIYTAFKEPENENLDLIKAVQAIKISQPSAKNSLRRSSEHKRLSPNSSIISSEKEYSKDSPGKEVSTLHIRDSRRNKTKSQSEKNLKPSQLNFQVDFDKSFEYKGLDHFDPFSSKFESIIKAKDESVLEHKFDPWGCQPHEEPSKPPPLPAKIIPLRVSSAIPFAHQIPESFRLSAATPITSMIPAPPNRVTGIIIEGIPLAISFTETVNAKFREPFSTTPHDVHTNGQLVISFPSSMVQQLESIGETQLMSIEPIHFSLVKAARLRNVEPHISSKDIILRIENPSEDTFSIYIDLVALFRKLTSQRHKEPSLPYFNIEIIKYDVTNSVKSNGSINAPVYISANWQFADPLTSHLIISYSFQWPNTNIGSLTFRPNATASSNADPEIQPRGEVRFLVSPDGAPQKMQSLPSCNWSIERGRASWRLDVSAGRSSIKSKFILANGPGTAQPVICQFSAEGAIESGVLLQVADSRFRISRHKYCLISGKYSWEPSPSVSGFCV